VKFLILPLDRSSVSFCYYNNPYAGEPPEPVPDRTVQRAVEFARAKDLMLNIICGRAAPPAHQTNLLLSVPNAIFVPLDLADLFPDALVAISAAEAEEGAARLAGAKRNLIVRLDRSWVPRLAAVLSALCPVAQRINLCLIDLCQLADADLEVYGAQLDLFASELADRYHHGEKPEVNALSDRLQLSGMRNCNAGVEHLTVGPDGRLHLCPAFMVDDPQADVGDLERGPSIPNEELLGLDRAPLCSVCDAWHCRRCIYLSKKLTLEVNVPSHQQCMASHLERAAAAKLLGLVRDIEPFASMAGIPELDYTDPFAVRDRLKAGSVPAGGNHRPVGTGNLSAITPLAVRGGDSVEGDGRGIQDVLMRILATQQKILDLLQAGKKGELP
jgi:CXXX repeat peptide maturase